MLGNTLAQGEGKTTAQNRSERVFNLCQLTDEQRQIAAIDTEVCFWLMLFRNGRVTQAQINQALGRLELEQQALYRERLNHWRPHFKSNKSLHDYSEQQWGKLLALFNKTISEK